MASPDQRGKAATGGLSLSRPAKIRLAIVTAIALFGIWGFGSLGVWQINRLAWKTDLIAQVDDRLAADPVPLPPASDWQDVSRDDEYTSVTLTGTYLNDEEVQIYTPSDYGPADWVLTPMELTSGGIVMVNRGIVPQDIALTGDFDRIDGETTVTGLLRISESEGWLFSRDSNPDEGLWYRRDIGSITEAKGFENAAPFFVDEELATTDSWPRGGQTVVSFRNSHLSYAITWFALALVVAVAFVLVLRFELKRR
ncbi:SURF1-like protein [Salipiger pallidus]|uniref:SURF1-like protein n=1 Tax=Salipiger pallidus TaxID=1775170 RepID=A0A8J2ZKH0_9RHOB|nr:SURF1 family protein [Salipiger pallidus]GGG74061.1 SURF1-like protein [Salipiger pallidus]